MPVKVVVGTQWGDEGKGKMVDYFSQDTKLVVRYQGGDNAGHTVINEFGVFKLHLIPCGVFRKGCKCLIGTGVVVNPDCLLEELTALKEANVDYSNLFVSDKAHLIMPYHVVLDEAMEKSGGIGTTKRGIGQAYSYKYLRKSVRAEDLRDLDKLREKLDGILELVNAQLVHFGVEPFTVDAIMEKAAEWQKAIGPMICDAFGTIHSHIANGDNILFEGQLGVMKDIDLGIYPYVTSSNPIAAYAAVSGGFSPRHIDSVSGVAKAFSSAVGDGPFPTEMADEDSAFFRGTGEKPDDEFGARTGRSRRIGWLDLPVLKFAHLVNGFDEITLTKVDKLDGLKEIKVCTDYMLDGKKLDYMPGTADLYRVEPVYTSLPGWDEDTSKCKTYAELPENAKAYVKYVSEAVGAPIKYIGNGPDREDIIINQQ